jgi:uncharacterized phage protein (TIGR01671 family)
MREILFRGKTPKYEPFNEGNNDKWVEGHFCKDSFAEKTYINENVGANNFFMYMVIPETVGEYTGLKDKNGKMIFEGDIVEATDSGCKKFYRIIFYDAEMAHFGTKWPKAKGEFALEGLTAYRIKIEGIRVVGNIHDNPELVEGGAK